MYDRIILFHIIVVFKLLLIVFAFFIIEPRILPPLFTIFCHLSQCFYDMAQFAINILTNRQDYAILSQKCSAHRAEGLFFHK